MQTNTTIVEIKRQREMQILTKGKKQQNKQLYIHIYIYTLH